MRESWRSLALAAALLVTVAGGVADAQTVIVTNAPPGSRVDVIFDTTTVGSATAGRTGDATVRWGLAPTGGGSETSARFYVDVCESVRRVLLVEPGLQPAEKPVDCERKDIYGVFLLRKVTTFVVDLNGPSVWLRQGPVPADWLKQEQERGQARPAHVSRSWRPAPTGLMLSAGGGFTSFADEVTMSCGDADTCSGSDFKGAYSIAAGFWFNKYLGIDIGYVKPSPVTTSGSGTTYSFSSSLDPQIWTGVGKVGYPFGPWRVYGLGGVNYHRATSSMTETIKDATITVGGVQQTISGGTQTLQVKFDGWGWVFGGGLEFWPIRALGGFVEGGRGSFPSSEINGGDATLDDSFTYLVAGVRLRLGGKAAKQ